MKCLKSLVIVAICSFLSVQSISAKNITVNDLNDPKLTNEDINRINVIYASLLKENKIDYSDALMMNIIKQRILYPNSDYKCLLKPLKEIAQNCLNERLKNLATNTYVILLSEMEMVIDKENLYNQNVDEFFTYINNQMPKMLAISPEI